MKIFDPKRHLPPGWNWENLKSNLLWGHFFSSLTILSFLSRYFRALDALYIYTQQPGGVLLRELVPTRTITPFRYLILGTPWLGLVCFTFVMAIQVWRYYASFSNGSMSIYLMRRLPDRMELHRRCWMQPLLSAAAELLLFGALTGLCWLLWYFVTPAPCRPF